MKTHNRRGVVVLVLVVVIATINIALISGAAASTEDAHTGVLRVETVRAFYAAESGGIVAAMGLSGGVDLPTEGSTITIGSQTVYFVEVREPSGEAVVEGRAGFARRRLDLQIE